MVLTYRKANKNDAEGIALVLKESYNIDSVEEGIKVFHEEVKKDYNYIVAESEHRILGIATWQTHGLFKHQLCELDRIAVLSEAKGKGVAKGLFDFLLNDANQAYKEKGYALRKLYILTHADNKRAQMFYEKMGCKHEAVLKDHFYEGKDEFVYTIFPDG